MKLHPHLSTSEYEIIIIETVKLPPPVLLSTATLKFILNAMLNHVHYSSKEYELTGFLP